MKRVEHLCGVYAIRNKATNKAYIGQSEDTHVRWVEHKWQLNHHQHRNLDLQKDWDLYGEDSFEHINLVECEQVQLRHYEILFIGLFNTTNPDFGYNYVGMKDVAETRSDFLCVKSKSMKRHYIEHPELTAKRFESIRAALQTPEHRELKRQAALQMHQNPEYAQRFKERNADPKYRKRISEVHKGMKPSEKAIERAKEMFSKPVRCIETGIVYPSAKEAARSLPGNLNINAVISGARKSAGGYHWESVEE